MLVSSALHMALGLADPDFFAAEQIESVSAVRAVRQTGRWNPRKKCLGKMLLFKCIGLDGNQDLDKRVQSSETTILGNLGKV